MIGAPSGPSLLVYIPTYNRFDLAVKQINLLAPQIDGLRTRLVVSDNASNDPRYASLAGLQDGERIQVYHRASNTGIAGNIMRAFDVPFGDFIWVLSDDEEIRSDSVAKILAVLAPECELVYLRSHIKGEDGGELPETAELTHVQFHALFAGFSMTGLISANVYNRRKIVSHAAVGQLFSNTLFPHTAMFLSQIAGSPTIRIRVVDDVVQWAQRPITYSDTYYRAWVYFLDLAGLVEPSCRALFIRKFLADWAWSHYLPVSVASGNLLTYGYYALRYPSCLPWFLYYLSCYPAIHAFRAAKPVLRNAFISLFGRKAYEELQARRKGERV